MAGFAAALGGAAGPLQQYGQHPYGPGAATLLLWTEERGSGRFAAHASLHGDVLQLLVPDGQAALESIESVWTAEFRRELGL